MQTEYGRSVLRTWSFWVDRGGTFTDIIAVSSNGDYHSIKVLSEDPDHYHDAVSFGIQSFLSEQHPTIPTENLSTLISEIKMGTTVATNALLERKGAATLLVVNQGFEDLMIIRDQSRANLFDQNIRRQSPLYRHVIGISARLDADGNEVVKLDKEAIKSQLLKFYQQGNQAIAIALMHSYRNPLHEQEVAELAKQIGYTTIVLSHQASPAPKLLPRAETTLIDAYLSPVVHDYVNRLQQTFRDTPIYFMQSNGHLVNAHLFDGKDAVLSGPAGGIVAMAKTANAAGFNKVIGFDMGGTSTDVSLYRGRFEITSNSEIQGTSLRIPMLAVHTVAAGGGSQLSFDGEKFSVGPASVGAHPGPVSYGRGEQLAVTDINVICGKIRPEYFPHVFGHNGQSPLDFERCRRAFESLQKEINNKLDSSFSVHEIAEQFLSIAVNAMANAIKTISTQKGIELTDYALNAFGGAGGQHACLVAEALGIDKIFIHAESSLLSAYGMGCSDIGQESEHYFGQPFSDSIWQEISDLSHQQFVEHKHKLAKIEGDLQHQIVCWLNYQGSDLTLAVTYDQYETMQQSFHRQHQERFGFSDELARIEIQKAHLSTQVSQPLIARKTEQLKPKDIQEHDVWFHDQFIKTSFIAAESIDYEQPLIGPVIIYDSNTTIVVEPNWQIKKTKGDHFSLSKLRKTKVENYNDTKLNPSRLEIFNSLYRHIAEQMGAVLQNTAQSVNIKERLDFSCALFDRTGNLIANAPHMPVHLGSMSDSVKHVIHKDLPFQKGDCFLLNSPYHGGTHLPDITVISPVFIQEELRFWVASRGHHADIGGITPGSMPAHSQSIEDEGVVIECFALIKGHQLDLAGLKRLLTTGKYPVRNFDQNLADLKAQVAANQRGISELQHACESYGVETISAYMNHVQDYAANAVRRAVAKFSPCSFAIDMDCGAHLSLSISPLKNQGLHFDFSGSSSQLKNNFNAPKSVAKAAILYVLRSLINEDLPLNEGCIRPVKITIPDGSMLSPTYPAAVVAGNVETSQVITDLVFGALGLQASAQGTMNNLTFGNAKYQYYETIAGGSGAGNHYDGCDGVQTHMTNSRITDPEILEMRFPVSLEQFKIRTSSGGSGKHKGGNGLIRRIRFLNEMTVSILSNNRINTPFGIHGGSPGTAGENRLISIDDGWKELPSSCELTVNAGEAIEIRTPGGGGYGFNESDSNESGYSDSGSPQNCSTE